MIVTALVEIYASYHCRFHGSPLDFDATQMKRLESNGTAVEPYSLYEAQLRKRLGYVPSWLSSLK